MTLFFLALNPEIQKKAQEEVDLVFKSNQQLNSVDISKLKYLRMCVKEAMRLHPPVPLPGRIRGHSIRFLLALKYFSTNRVNKM